MKEGATQRIKAVVNLDPKTGFEKKNPVELRLAQGGSFIKIGLTGSEAQNLMCELRDIVYKLKIKEVRAILQKGLDK